MKDAMGLNVKIGDTVDVPDGGTRDMWAFGFVGKTLCCPDDTTGRKRKTKSRSKESTDFLKGHSKGVLQFSGNSNRIGAKYMVCSAQRLRCLFGVSCLNPFHATRTVTYRNAELRDNGNDTRKFGLILTMNNNVLKLTMAVRAWNDGNFDNTIDFLRGRL